MKTIIFTIACSIFVFYSIDLFPQTKTITFEDGYQVDVDILSVNPDEGRNVCVYAGVFATEGVQNIGMSYYNPGKYFINGMIGRSGYFVDGNIIFLSYFKDSRISQSVETHYRLDVPIKKRRAFAFHFGSNSVDYKYSMLEGPTSQLSAIGVFGGVSTIKSIHTKWQLSNRTKLVQGTAIIRWHFDVVYFLNRKAHYPLGFVGDLDDLVNKIGYRFYYDGKHSFWTKYGRFSVNGILGVAIKADKENFILPFFCGMGLGYNFDFKKRN